MGADAQGLGIGLEKAHQFVLLRTISGSNCLKNTGSVGCGEEGGKRLF
jgi:hypothetical protein